MTTYCYKPCPFCGCEQVSSALMPNMKWIIGCLDCGVRTKEHDSLLEAAETWNRRADHCEDAPDEPRHIKDILSDMGLPMGQPAEETPF
ncbi:MAG: Lar family restriction alleviation protein [Synergistaceae bacterium]|nr:Lar family restriction alleviation protein [Synergistaceae bacterium]